MLCHQKIGCTFFAALVLLCLRPEVQAETITLSATTNLDGGAPIPTDVGSFNDTNDTAPYVYYIDSDPSDVNQQTLVAFDMGAFNLTNPGGSSEDVTIHALSLSHGTGGTFDFSAGSSARPDLTINVTEALAARSVSTRGTSGKNRGGAVTLTAPKGITLAGGIDTRGGPSGCGNNGGKISLTSTGSTGFIHIDGIIVTSAQWASPGTVTLTAENGINLSAGINTAAYGNNGASGGAITVNGGTGPVSIGTITANAIGTGKDGTLKITTQNNITLGTLDLSLVKEVSLLASSVEIDTLLNVSGYLTGSNFTGFYNVSSDVFYNPANSDAALAGLTYTIVEGNGDAGDCRLMPIPEPGTLALLGMALLGLGWYAWRKRR